MYFEICKYNKSKFLDVKLSLYTVALETWISRTVNLIFKQYCKYTIHSGHHITM
jgi:hypothetical protein